MMKNTKHMKEDVVSFADYKAKEDDTITNVHINAVIITGCEGPNDDNRFPFGKEISFEDAQALINKEDYKLYASGVGYYDKCFVQPKFTVNGEEKAISDYLKYSSDLRLDLGDGAKYGYENISIIEHLKSILENSGGLKNVTIDNKEVPYDKDAYEKEFGTLDANIDKYLDSHKVELPQDVDYSKKTKEEITVGDIFHNEYDFYTVTRKTKSSVWLAPLKAKNLSVPVKGNGRIDYSRYVYPTKEINQELLEKGTYKVDFKKPFRLTDKYSNYLRAEQGAGHYKAVVYAWNGKSLFAESFEEKSVYAQLNEELEKLLKRKNESLKEDKSEELKNIFEEIFKGGKMNCFETKQGVIYFEPQGEKLVFGDMTNGGIIPQYEFDYEFSKSFDFNLQGMIEQIMEEEGYPIDEDYSDLQNDKSLDVYRKVLNGNKIIDDYVFQDKKHVLVKFHNVKSQDRKQIIILDDKFEERLNKAYNKCRKESECKESYHPFDTEGKVETRNYKGIEYTVLPNGEYGDIKIYAPKGQSFNNGDTFYSTSSKLTDTDELVKKIVDGQVAKGYFVLGESLNEDDKFFKKGKLTPLPKKPAKFNIGDKVTVDNKKGEIIKVKPMKLSDTCVYDIKLEDGKIVDRYEEEINESLKDDCIDIVVPYDLATYISNGDRSPIDFDKETYEPMFDKAEEYQRMGDVEILDDTEDYDVLTDDFGFQNHVITIRIHKNKNETLKEEVLDSTTFDEALLHKLLKECNAFLRNPNTENLWAKDIDKQIDALKKCLNVVKDTNLTIERINKLKDEMNTAVAEVEPYGDFTITHYAKFSLGKPDKKEHITNMSLTDAIEYVKEMYLDEHIKEYVILTDNTNDEEIVRKDWDNEYIWNKKYHNPFDESLTEDMKEVADFYDIEYSEFNKNHKWGSYEDIPKEWEEFITDSNQTFSDAKNFLEKRYGLFVERLGDIIESAYIQIKVHNSPYNYKSTKSAVITLFRSEIVEINYIELAEKILKEVEDRYPEFSLKNESLKETEETVEEKLKHIEDEIRDEIEKIYGDDKDLMEFFFVEYGIKKGYYDNGSDMNYIEVRTELGYNDLIELAEKLDVILQKYDEDAYFDMEGGGIITAVIDFDRKDYVAPYIVVIKDKEAEPTILHCDTFEEGRDLYIQIANSPNRKKIEKLTFEKLDGDTYKTIEEISPKTIGESLNEGLYGLKDVRYISHGDWSDGEVEYQGFLYNATEVTEFVYNDYVEYCKENGEQESDDGFDKWIKDNTDYVYSALSVLNPQEAYAIFKKDEIIAIYGDADTAFTKALELGAEEQEDGFLTGEFDVAEMKDYTWYRMNRYKDMPDGGKIRDVKDSDWGKTKINESLDETVAERYPQMLSTLLRKCWYDGNGRFARNGKWSIGLGGYDHGYEVYYEGDTICQIKPTDEVYFGRDENTVKGICGYGYEQILKAVQQVEPKAFIDVEQEYALDIYHDENNIRELSDFFNNLGLELSFEGKNRARYYSKDEAYLKELSIEVEKLNSVKETEIREVY